MGDIQNTQYFKAVQETPVEVTRVLRDVYIALTEKGYNPVNQIVGYIMSGDPTYITSHKGARSLIILHAQATALSLSRGLAPCLL